MILLEISIFEVLMAGGTYLFAIFAIIYAIAWFACEGKQAEEAMWKVCFFVVLAIGADYIHGKIKNERLAEYQLQQTIQRINMQNPPQPYTPSFTGAQSDHNGKGCDICDCKSCVTGNWDAYYCTKCRHRSEDHNQ